MPGKTPDHRPIQVFLDTKRFIEVPEALPFRGGAKDFFAGNNGGFADHKQRMKSRVESIADTMRRAGQPGGFFKVRQREQALAKSHRPLGALFSKQNSFALVGADRVGELLIQATPAALDKLAGVIDSKAELEPRQVLDKDGKQRPRVSNYRSELGGIEDIQAYLASDRFGFSGRDAVGWMKQPAVIGGYIVELFRPDRSVNPTAVDSMIRALSDALRQLAGGLLIRPLLPSSASPDHGQPSLALSIHLIEGDRRLIRLPFGEAGNPLQIDEASLPDAMHGVTPDLTVARHAALLSLLATQALGADLILTNFSGLKSA